MGTGAIRVRSGESGVQPLENLPVARSRGNEGRGNAGAGRRRGAFTAAGSTVGAAEISNAERGGRGVESGGDYRAVDPKPQSLTLSG